MTLFLAAACAFLAGVITGTLAAVVIARRPRAPLFPPGAASESVRSAPHFSIDTPADQHPPRYPTEPTT